MNSPDVFGTGDARILDRGYRSYDGSRTGIWGAIRALVGHSVQRALGMRRTFWAKLLPIAGAAIAYVPAIVFIGIVALVDTSEIRSRRNPLPTYGEYYSFIIAAIMVFVALVAPEVLCTDRRSGMLGVYLSSPLDRDTYLVAKALSIAAVLSTVCLGPPLLMLVANVLQSQARGNAGDITVTMLRVLATGVAVTLLYTGITMGIASLTDRKAIASAGIILLFLVTLAVTGTLTSTGTFSDIQALAPTLLTLELAARVHGERSEIMPGASSVTVWVAWLAWSIGGFALARFQLNRLPVTR